MLRSFSYVSAVATNHATTERPADRHRLGPLVQTWEARDHAKLSSRVTATPSAAARPGRPMPAPAQRLIEFFVIEKALYELRYEMDNRPDWLAIPLFSLLRRSTTTKEHD